MKLKKVGDNVYVDSDGQHYEKRWWRFVKVKSGPQTETAMFPIILAFLIGLVIGFAVSYFL